MARTQWTLKNLLLATSVFAGVLWGLFVHLPLIPLNPLSVVLFALALTYGLFGCRGRRRSFWTFFAFSGWVVAYVNQIPLLSVYYTNLRFTWSSSSISFFIDRYGAGIELAALMRIFDFMTAAVLATLVASWSCLVYSGLDYVPPGSPRRILIGVLLVGAIAGMLICLNVLVTEFNYNTYSRAAVRAILLLPVFVAQNCAIFGWIAVKVVRVGDPQCLGGEP